MPLILYIDLSRAMNYVLTVEDEEATPEIDCPVVGDDIDILTVEDVLYLVLELDDILIKREKLTLKGKVNGKCDLEIRLQKAMWSSIWFLVLTPTKIYGVNLRMFLDSPVEKEERRRRSGFRSRQSGLDVELH
ncbi:hypothetical protein L1887_24044 [Cichorium endivia]|nr:hypothetical protein L1887_24044 [Cichorium endivia]